MLLESQVFTVGKNTVQSIVRDLTERNTKYDSKLNMILDTYKINVFVIVLAVY